jgi:predicted deacetylase
MRAKYLLRFDDICPTMRWSLWNAVEALLERYDVHPILAVVPDNHDPELVVEAFRSDFWEWVRQKQLRGWCIGLHGYQYRYETSEAGLLCINARSEFAGLPVAVQEDKLRRGLAIFEAHGVRADAFVAPAHSFDEATLQALRNLRLQIISDGFFRRPCSYQGLLWIPQQIWQFRRMPAGVWTVCCHPNHWSVRDLQNLERFLERFRPQLMTFEEAVCLASHTPAQRRDLVFSWLWSSVLRGRLRAKHFLRMHRRL